MGNRLDHFMYAVPSLDEGMAWAAETFGVEPAYGGERRVPPVDLAEDLKQVRAPRESAASIPTGLRDT